MTDLNSAIRARIEAFVQDLNSLVRTAAVDAVQQALGAGSVPSVRRGRPPGVASASRPAYGGKREPEEIAKTVENLAAFIGAHPGERLEQISAGLSVPSDDLKLPIKKLLASNRVKKKGQKRGTRYFPAGHSAAPAKVAAVPMAMPAPEKPRRGGARG